MSMSPEVSTAKVLSAAGSGAGAPFWLTLLKQPVADVQAGRLYCVR